MNIYPTFIFTSILIISCSTTHLVKNENAAYRELNKKLKGEDVSLLLLTGDELEGYNIEVEPESTTIGERKIATKSIKEITIKNSGRGALKGIGLGVASTLVLSAISYFSNQDEPYAEVAFIIFPPAGLVLGAIIGAAGGDIDRFVFPYQQDTNSDPYVRVEFSSILERGRGYIIILWQGKEVRLSKDEYSYRGTTEDGKLFIMVSDNIYNSKFQVK
jgi:hypothetical protein